MISRPGYLAVFSLMLCAAQATAQMPAGQPAPVASTDPLPAVPTALQRCDRAIAEVETMAQKLADCSQFLEKELAATQAQQAVKTSTAARGLPDTRFDAIPEDISTPGAKDLLFAAAPAALRAHLVDYFTYSAYAAGDRSVCDRLAAIDYLERPCQREFFHLNEARARMGELWELVRACHQPGNPAPPKCCVIIAKLRDRSDPCRDMVPSCMPDLGTCKAFWDRASGDAKVCAGITAFAAEDCAADGCRARRAEDIARCESDALYARAFKAKDVAECAGSSRCRVLMGEGRKVAEEIAAVHLQNPAGAWFLKSGWKAPPPPMETATPFAERNRSMDYKGFVCTEPLRSADNRKVVGSLLLAAMTCLSDAEAAASVSTPSRALIEGIDERGEKLGRLSERIDRTFGTAPAPASAPRPKSSR